MWFFGITVDDSVRRLFVQRLCRAIELAGLTEQQACAEMGIKPSQWCAQKNGSEHVSYTRMMLLPREVWRWLAVVIAHEEGLPSFMNAAVNLAAAADRPLLKMETQPSRRKAALA